MSGLSYLPPTVRRSVTPTLAPVGSQDKQRNQRSPWRKWYSLKRWKDMRERVLLAAMYTCAMCGRLEGNTAKLVADHIKPHRGNPVLFWNESNLQVLCSECHSSVKQSEEQAELVGVWD